MENPERNLPKDENGNVIGKGRAAGSQNKTTLLSSFIAKYNLDPFEEMVKRYRDPKLKEATHNMMLDMISSRLIPQIKSIEIKSEQAADILDRLGTLDFSGGKVKIIPKEDENKDAGTE